MADTPGPSGEGSRFRLRESAFEVLAAAIDCQDDSDITIEETEAESDGSYDLVSDSDSHDGSDWSYDETRPETESAAGPSTTAEDWRRIQPPEAMKDGPDFRVRHPGPNYAPPRHADPIEYFNLFFDEAALTHLVRETNRYARNFLRQENVIRWIESHPSSRLKRWPDEGFHLEDIKKYLGLCINMGLVRKTYLPEFWSSEEPVETPYFSHVMPLWKFLLLNRMFHVSNAADEKKRGQPGFDPWAKVRPVLDSLNHKFKHFYTPSKNISVDESMIRMKNRQVYIQYMPNKRHARFGLKKFQLCDANGYVCHVELYAGKDFDVHSDEGQAHAVVMKLMQDCNLLDKGYHLYTDNFYTKPALAEVLMERATLLTGTVRANSRGLPEVVKTARLQVGEVQYFRKESLLCAAFREKKSKTKPVLVLSTAHVAENVQQMRRGKAVTKPSMIWDYNKYMGGVDLSDKKLTHYAAERPTHRYWTKIFKNLLDICILNAYEIYCLNIDARKISKRKFIIQVVKCLCGPTSGSSSAPPPPLPEHRLVKLPGKKERLCVVCTQSSSGKGRKRSRTYCPGCDVGCHMDCEPQLQHYRRIRKRGREMGPAQEGEED